jgi:hypothetical protein
MTMAKIKLKYDKKDDVPEAFLELYEEKDGAWLLVGIEGMKTQKDIDALKLVVDKERKLRTDAEGKAKKFEKLGEQDPEELLKAIDELEELKIKLEETEGKAKDKPTEEAIQKRIDAAVTRATNPIARKLTAAEAALKTATETAEGLGKKIKRSTLEAELTKQATALKVRPEALADIHRYQDAFEVGDDGTIQTKEGNGFPPGIGIDVWLSDMKETRPHWWPDSVGGGARGGAGGAPLTGNPFDPKAPNLTKASELMGTDPAKAAQFAKAAGFASTDAAVKAMATAAASPLKSIAK